jgi:hypothetical protein
MDARMTYNYLQKLPGDAQLGLSMLEMQPDMGALLCQYLKVCVEVPMLEAAAVVM